MINISKKNFLFYFFICFFASSHTTETDKRLILEKTINFFDNKVIPVFSAGFIFYQVTKNKIPLFKKISEKTEKRINFYSPMSLLTLYSLFRVLNQQELINKKHITSPVSKAQVGEKIVYINEKGERRDELPKNAIVVHM